MLALLFSTIAFGVPQQLTQQGRLLDSDGIPVEGTHVITTQLFDAPLSSNMIWGESLTVVFNNGYYSLILGTDNNNKLDSTVLDQEVLYLELQIDNDPPLQPRQKLSAAPYAVRAQVATELEGGAVDASEIAVNGTLVIDGTGAFVGPLLEPMWGSIQSVPAGFADGIDDVLTEQDVVGIVNQSAIDLQAGTTSGGVELATVEDLGWSSISDRPAGLDDGDDDSLSGLSCSGGEIVVFDMNSGAWACGEDSDTTLTSNEVQAMIQAMSNLALQGAVTVDGSPVVTEASLEWSGIKNRPAGLDDGDDVLSESEVLGAVQSAPVSLASGSDVDGSSILVDPGCADQQVLQYDASASSWTCIDFSGALDADQDGHFAWSDCDDLDPNVPLQDGDCDGVLTVDDCDDNDATSTTVATDGDCDGVLTADDCDDNDALSTFLSEDADCDGARAADDCDDNDPLSHFISEDADCDDVLTADDCDDDNPDVSYFGAESSCPSTSCLDILNAGYSTGDGLYWIDPAETGAYEVYCDMTTEGGGWTRVLKLTSADYKSISGVPNDQEYVNNGSWVFTKTMLKESNREVMFIEVSPPYRQHRYDFKQGSNLSGEDFVGAVTGDKGGSVAIWNYSTSAWQIASNGQCNSNNHSQWNCEPATGVRFHYATRDWTGDGGSSYGDGNWGFTGYTTTANANPVPFIKNWDGNYNQTPHDMYVR